MRIGELDNGLTYYLRSNSAPGESLELRLVVDAGSLQQEVENDGSAHFLEHMLFNGTEKYPANALDDVLSRLGAEIGPDLNAYTSYDETVYFLSLPADDREAVETGFDILFEWADRALIDPEEVVAERGVVREEVRLSAEAPGAAVSDAFDDAYYADSSYAGRSPGGDQELILATTEASLRDFYDSWYRPDLMAIVAVGDLPLGVMEEEIVDRFASFEARAGSPPREDPTVGPISEPDLRIVAEPSISTRFTSVDYWLPNRDLSSADGEHADLMDRLAADMIGNRLRDAVARGETEMIDPIVSVFNEVRDMRFLGFNATGPDLGAATEFILVEMADVITNGFTADELARSVAAFQAAADLNLQISQTRQDGDFADLYTAHFLAGADISSPEATHERLSTALAEVDAAEVSANLSLALADSAPIAIVVGPDADDLPSRADLQAAVMAGEAALGAAPDEAAEDAPVLTELMERPAAVDEISAADLPPLSPGGQTCGVCGRAPVEVVFENGVTLRFVESTIAASQATLSAASLGGWSTLPVGAAGLAPLATAAVVGSGLGDLDRVELERFLATSSAQVVPYIDETIEGFVGGAGEDDLETMFQLLHLLVTTARVDTPALSSAVRSGRDLSAAAEVDPGVAFDVALRDLRYDGSDAQQLVPTEDDLDNFTEESALDLYNSRFGQVDDLVVAIAGDVDRELVLDLARSYLGTLPAGPSDSWQNLQPPAPQGIVSETLTIGSEDSAGAVALLYTTDGQPSAALRVGTRLTEVLLNARLFESLRESLAATYGGSVSVFVQSLPTGLIDALVQIEGDPDRLDEIHAAVLAELEDLAENGPDAEEFAQALAVVAQDYSLVNNGTALELLLSPEQRPGEQVLNLDLRQEILEELTRGDVQLLVQLLFPTDQRVELFRTPES